MDISEKDLLTTYKVLKIVKESEKPSLSNMFKCVIDIIANIIVDKHIEDIKNKKNI